MAYQDRMLAEPILKLMMSDPGATLVKVTELGRWICRMVRTDPRSGLAGARVFPLAGQRVLMPSFVPHFPKRWVK